MTTETLTETSEELAVALSEQLGAALGRDSLLCYPLNTGGGCMVMACDLTIDGRMMGRQAWLTREDDWVLGFYDYYNDESDMGVCVSLLLSSHDANDPAAVATAVAGIFVRLGVTKLQGE